MEYKLLIKYRNNPLVDKFNAMLDETLDCVNKLDYKIEKRERQLASLRDMRNRADGKRNGLIKARETLIEHFEENGDS